MFFDPLRRIVYCCCGNHVQQALFCRLALCSWRICFFNNRPYYSR